VGGGFGFPEIGEIGARLEAAAVARDAGAMRTAVDDLERFLERPPTPVAVRSGG
jgi:hypothetical protein